MFIFSYFLTFFPKIGNSYSVKLIFIYFNYKCHPDGSNWSVHCIEKQTNLILSEAIQNKIVYSCRILQISIIWSFTNINRVFSQWLIINYGTTYNLSFWYHTTKYINVLNNALQYSDQVYALICTNHLKKQLN